MNFNLLVKMACFTCHFHCASLLIKLFSSTTLSSLSFVAFICWQSTLSGFPLYWLDLLSFIQTMLLHKTLISLFIIVSNTTAYSRSKLGVSSEHSNCTQTYQQNIFLYIYLRQNRKSIFSSTSKSVPGFQVFSPLKCRWV